MLRVSKKALYAVEAVLDVAYHGGSGAVSSLDIARRQGIPRRYLEQVLQALVHAGLLAGQRGPRGGYRLARERRRITVGDILAVVAAREGAEDPLEASPGSALGLQVLRPLLQDSLQQMLDSLQSITIETLCERGRSAGIDSEARAQPDFSI